MNKVTTVAEEPVHPTVSSVDPGTVFRYWNGDVVFMKCSDNRIVALGTGMLFLNPSDANVVIFPAVKIQAEP